MFLIDDQQCSFVEVGNGGVEKYDFAGIRFRIIFPDPYRLNHETCFPSKIF